MCGEADYFYLDHDAKSVNRKIMICTTKDIDNPMPTVVKFVHDSALSEKSLRVRAGTAGAAAIIALSHDDNDTLAAALAAAAHYTTGHLMAHFQQQAFADGALRARGGEGEQRHHDAGACGARPGQLARASYLLLVMTGNTLSSVRAPATAALTT